MTQNKVIVIGLTGGIGSGKTTVAKYLVDQGYPVVDADLIAREVVEPGQMALREIESTFGTEFINKEGGLDRKKLGALVFNDPLSLDKLNEIMHKRIFEKTWERVDELKRNHAIIFVDVPLLIETKQLEFYDAVWLVYVNRDLQLERLMKRDQITLEFAEKQLASQMPLEDKIPYATKVINNETTLDLLYQYVDGLLKALLKEL